MKPDISVVIPAYNEGDSVGELYRQIKESVRSMREDGLIAGCEVLFVDDGSTDGTAQRIRELHSQDPDVHLLSLRRNFGKSTALNTGFHHVSGQIVFTMDADLQDDPAEFPRFIRKLNEGFDLVVGWKKNRLDPLEKRLPSRLFNRVVSRFSGVKLHDHDCGFKAFRREVIEATDLYGELHRYIPVLAYRQGFRIAEITVKHHKRAFGRSKYGAERYVRGMLDCFTTAFLLRYGDRPMYFFGKIGLLSFLAGFVICTYLSVLRFTGTKIGGRPLLVLGVMLILLGIQFFSTGFIGNLLVDVSHRGLYREDHIREIL
ncbi:MAG: glycosyltransferase family 2 protein [Clostridia bacterium]|nr:glycosyltransferase family 2 protein [Clostridia bacterium]